MRSWLLVLMIVGMVASCARNRRGVDDYQRNADSTVHVENHHWGDVDIFVIHDGQRSRLGMVTAVAEKTFTMSSRLIGTMGSMQLQAHAVGMPGNLNSETIAIRPGMEINWSLESNLSRASLSVY